MKLFVAILVTCLVYMSLSMVEGKPATYLIETKDEEPAGTIDVDETVDAVSEETVNPLDSGYGKYKEAGEGGKYEAKPKRRFRLRYG